MEHWRLIQPVQKSSTLLRKKSPGSMASIDLQITCRHEGRSITHQENCRTPIFVRQTQLAKHIMRRPIPLPLRELFEERLDHRRDNISW